MKSQYILASILAVIFLIAIVSAAVIVQQSAFQGIIEPNNDLTVTNTAVNNVNALGFICSSANCATISSSLFPGIINSGNSNKINITYPTDIQSQNGYGIYFYKDGYIPYEVASDWSGNDVVGPFNVYPSKQRICESRIISINTNKTANNIIVTVKVAAPINHSGTLNYIPSQISSHYSSNVTINFAAIQNGVQFYADQRILSIPFSGQGSFTFTVAANPALNNYSANITTSVNDLKCLSSSSQSRTVQVSNTTSPSTTAPQLTIISPENRTYNTSTIPVNFLAVNATQVRFSTTGISNEEYFGTTHIHLPDGQHTLTAVASNSNSSVIKSVTFVINTTSSSQNETNLTLPTIKINSPRNITYNASTVLVNITSTNAESIRFSTTGISNRVYFGVVPISLPNGTHTLTAVASNANGSTSTSVTFTILLPSSQTNQTTPSNETEDDEDGPDNNRRSNRFFGDRINITQESQPIYLTSFQDDSNSSIILKGKEDKKSFNLSIFNLILIILLLLLIIIIILVIIRNVM